MKNIAIFASGSGTNAQQIAEYFRSSDLARIALILSNKPDAFVLERAKKFNIPTVTFSRNDFYESDIIMDILKQHNIDIIVLAGFLWFVPENILRGYPRRIINIHPALLPKHGGKGMYGEKVHQAVIQSGDKRTGITIHFVNDHYDEGEIIFQDSFEVLPGDTPESIALKVHQLEYLHFPRIIETVVKSTSASHRFDI